MKVSKRQIAAGLFLTGSCPKEFELEKKGCFGELVENSCTDCWMHALKDVEVLELIDDEVIE